MNLERVFDLFGFFDNDKETNKRLEQEVDDYKSTPHFKVKMFIKLINNGIIFKRQVIDFFQQADPSLDKADINEAGDFVMYTRAWFWISQCDLTDEKWQECLRFIPHTKLNECINPCVEHYLALEEYEKCALLKQIQDFIKNT